MAELFKHSITLNGTTANLTVHQSNGDYAFDFNGVTYLALLSDGRLAKVPLQVNTGGLPLNKKGLIKTKEEPGRATGATKNLGSLLMKINQDDTLLDVFECDEDIWFRVSANVPGCLFGFDKDAGKLWRARCIGSTLPFQLNKKGQIRWVK